ncbi:hypothetical protein RB653_009295 [Dictyostelium firmibasis]|uniref:Large ribosomal subunit protein bL32m n=1 Tax=Dictyostelium firmibasis TaxID=79012 RepID=A0AAN7U1P4_9MYCE
MQRSLLGSLINGGKKFSTPVTPFRQNNCIIPSQPLFTQQPQQILQPSENKIEIPTVEEGEIELTAVPKKRTSYTRNRKRNSSKKHENIHNYTICQKCSSPKLRHNLCNVCLRKNGV